MSTLYNHDQPLLAADLVNGAFPDPVRLVLLDLFRAAILHRLGDVWSTVASGTPLTGTTPVQDFYLAPLSKELLQQRKCEFPLLLLDRVGTADFNDETQEIERRTQPWDLHWILGGLEIGHLFRFRAALTHVIPSLVNDICSGGGVHPAYNSGNSVFGPGGIPVGSLRLVNHNADSLEIQGRAETRLYHGVTMRLETTEYDAEDTSSYPDFLTADVAIAVGGGSGGLIPGFIRREVTIGT